jgi:hypothetical protein
MSTPFSSKLGPRDHARLAQRLADGVARVREARLQHRDVELARDELYAFLTDDLIPYLHSEEAGLYASSKDSHRLRRLRPGNRRVSRHLREHRQLIRAAEAVHSATTALQVLTCAERVVRLFDAHLSAEDRELLATSRRQAGDGSTLAAALAAELNEVIVHDHARIGQHIQLAQRASTGDVANRMAACDRAIASLSQHASVMSTGAYPMVRPLLQGSAAETVGRLIADLRRAERAMRHLNGLLRGAARENPRGEQLLWEEVEQAWRRHISDEEPLLRRLAPLLPPEREVSLMASLRGPFRHYLTRPHPVLLRAGWPTGMAIKAQYRIDRWRDVLDNRSR